ncbi:MAG: glycosyltransferase, partial [Gammaproteobacteria bacterium]|nr:glycosyltransferase [Gammaproteobacteria bacterium]
EGVLLTELVAKGARHVDIDFRFREPARLLAVSRKLRCIVRDQSIELVAPQSVRSTIAAWTALRLLPAGYRVAATGKRPPIVTTIHNIHNPKNFRSAAKILRRCTDYVIFESHYERNRLLQHGLSPDRSAVIHSGIDLARLAAPSQAEQLGLRYGIDPSRHFVFGIVARLSEEKGHRYLIEAFARIADQRDDLRLLIVGDGPLLETIERQADASGVGSRTIFTGMQRDIPSHLALFDVFTLCSTRESFPLAAREAMAAGKAVIAPRIGGCPEVVEDGVTGLLFEAADVDDLAAKMTTLADRDVCSRYGRAGRRRAERLFSRESWVEGDEKIYLHWAAA